MKDVQFVVFLDTPTQIEGLAAFVTYIFESIKLMRFCTTDLFI